MTAFIFYGALLIATIYALVRVKDGILQISREGLSEAAQRDSGAAFAGRGHQPWTGSAPRRQGSAKTGPLEPSHSGQQADVHLDIVLASSHDAVDVGPHEGWSLTGTRVKARSLRYETAPPEPA